MSDGPNPPIAPAPPKYRYGWLWAVLAILLTIGTAGSAFVVYGAQEALFGGAWILYVPMAIGGGFVALVCILLITGILYRVDRLRGTPHREVALFE